MVMSSVFRGPDCGKRGSTATHHKYDQDFANHPAPDVEAHEEESDGLPCSGKINIGPYTVVIFSQDV